ncbi:MAG TPA: NFACT RNA binding domain-containing protein, partial [Blastocatellia bacterium]
KSVNSDVARFEDPARFKRYGDLLLANLASLRQARTGAVVTDLFDDAQADIEIEMEEGETPQQAASRYYELYQRARRALRVLEPRAKSIADRAASLEQLSESLKIDPTSTTLSVIERQLGLGAEQAKQPQGRKSSKKNKAKSHSLVTGRRFLSTEGYEIIVGKSDRENDAITFRVAGSQDIWLHAADYPGSHVVVRNPRRDAVPFKTIVEAAEIAAHYSQAKKEKKAAVHYTQKKFVTKPPKAKPGLVRLSSFKTVMVEPGIKVKKADESPDPAA